MSAHTPGPWVADNGDSAVWVIAQRASGDVLAELMLDHGPKDEANARLIAAAPELLAIAKECAASCAACLGDVRGKPVYGRVGEGVLHYVDCKDCAQVRAILAKAQP